MSRRSNHRGIPARPSESRRGIPRAAQNPDPAHFGQRANAATQRGNPQQQEEREFRDFADVEDRLIDSPTVRGAVGDQIAVSIMISGSYEYTVRDVSAQPVQINRADKGFYVNGSFVSHDVYIGIGLVPGEFSGLEYFTPEQITEALAETLRKMSRKPDPRPSPLNPGAPRRKFRLTTQE